MGNRITLFVLGLLLFGALPAHPAHIVDMAGRPHHFDAPPERVVGVGPGALRMLVYMEQVGRVAAVEGFEFTDPSSYRPYFTAYRQEFSKLPRFSGSRHGGGIPEGLGDDLARFDLDAVIIAGVSAGAADALQERLGVPVVMVRYGVNLGEYSAQAMASLRVLGRVFFNPERAEYLADIIRATEDDLARRTARSISPRVYVGGVAFKGPKGFASTEAGFPPLSLVGALNIANHYGVRTHLTLTKQQIADGEPQVVFIDLSGMPQVKREIEADPAFFKSLPGVRNGRVFVLIPYNSYNTNIESLYLSAYFIGKILHPLSFSDIVPEDEAARISRVFLGRSICGILVDMETVCDPIDLL